MDMGYIVREPIINATFGDIHYRRYVHTLEKKVQISQDATVARHVEFQCDHWVGTSGYI